MKVKKLIEDLKKKAEEYSIEVEKYLQNPKENSYLKVFLEGKIYGFMNAVMSLSFSFNIFNQSENKKYQELLELDNFLENLNVQLNTKVIPSDQKSKEAKIDAESQ